jgi:hypothetical protein
MVFNSPTSRSPYRLLQVGQVQRKGDKKCQLSSPIFRSLKKNLFNYGELNENGHFGIENAINECKVQ